MAAEVCPVCEKDLVDEQGRSEVNECHECGAVVHAGPCTEEHVATHQPPVQE